ncbi:MAG: hypothetical protein ACO3YQ_08185, partial [Flavobacteriales bacterium]
MTDESKTVRLNKIAREFNLGVATIVEFLGGKGIAVENSPNAKVDAEAYALLRANFQGEKEAKEKAISSTRALAGRESVTIDSSRRRGDDSGSGMIDLSIFQKSAQQPVVERITTAPTPAPAPVEAVAPPAPTPEPAPKPVPAPAPAAEAPQPAPAAVEETVAPVPTPVEAPAAPVAEAPAAEPAVRESRVKVVGKMDLADLAPKKKAAKPTPSPTPPPPSTST